MSISSLESTIHNILSAPDTDLKTISAKRVRKLIPALRPDITAEFVKNNKEEINNLIGKIFKSFTPAAEEENSGSGQESPASAISKRKREDTDELEEAGNDYGYDSKPMTKKSKAKSSSKLTDEAYARQLSSEINQRPARSSRNQVKTRKGLTKGSRSKKTRKDIVDSDMEGDVDDDDDDDDDQEEEEENATSGKRKASKSRKRSRSVGESKNGFSKEHSLSEPLSAVVGTAQLSRPQVVKKLWEYIKARQLQNPNNKREILCDDPLRTLFNTDKINMFTMNKVLSNHLYPLE